MARTPERPNKDNLPEQRRIKAAKDLEHLVIGGKDMPDDQLEIALDLGLRPRK